MNLFTLHIGHVHHVLKIPAHINVHEQFPAIHFSICYFVYRVKIVYFIVLYFIFILQIQRVTKPLDIEHVRKVHYKA